MGHWVKITNKTPKSLRRSLSKTAVRYYVTTKGGRSYVHTGNIGTSSKPSYGWIAVSGSSNKPTGAFYTKKTHGGGIKLAGFFDTPEGKAAEKSYLNKLYEKRKEQEREALRKKVIAQKAYEGQVDVLRGDLDSQFGEVISGLKGRRWSPRVAAGRKSKAAELSTMQKKLAGLSRDKWLTEVEELSKEQTTKTKAPRKRRLTRSAYDTKLMSGVGRRLSGRK